MFGLQMTRVFVIAKKNKKRRGLRPGCHAAAPRASQVLQSPSKLDEYHRIHESPSGNQAIFLSGLKLGNVQSEMSLEKQPGLRTESRT